MPSRGVYEERQKGKNEVGGLEGYEVKILRAVFLVDPTYPSLHNKRPLLAFLSRPYISGGGRFRRQVL